MKLRREVDFQKFHRLFYPVVAVVITAQNGGAVGAMTAISCIPLSFNPPLVALSMFPKSRTFRLMVKSGYFSVHWLDYKHADKLVRLGGPTPKGLANKLESVGLKTIGARKVPMNVIEDSVAVLECRVKESHRTGDHELIVGEVLAAYAIGDFMDYWTFSSYVPALYLGLESRRPFIPLRVPRP